MRIHTTHSRDAALRDLHRINRWMIAGSVILTGVLSDVAANAFPGKTVKSSAAAKKALSAQAKHQHTGSSQTSTGVLRPPEKAPQASGESQPSQQAQSSEAAPSQESAPAHESAPEPAPEAEAPVVSGGS